MDLRQLRHFRQIAESGSLSAAAAVLHIAQPALSRQMRALEEELGIRLFHRTGRGVQLTAGGQTLLLEAQKLLADADAASQRIRALGKRMAGEATIGLPPTIGRLISLALVQRVRADFPELRLRLSEGFSGTLLEWLQTGRIDAAILYEMPASGAIRAEPVAREPLSIIGGSDIQPFPSGAAVPITALAGQPLILPTPSHGLRRTVEQHAAATGAAIDLMLELDSLDTTITMVREEKALTILPESVVRAELDAGRLQAWRIGDPPLMRPLIVATASQRSDAISVLEIASLLRETILSAASQAGWETAAN